jgi:uncharacterized protein YoxC
MMHSTINQRVKRVNEIIQHVDELNERARLLMMLIEKEDREEKDKIRYAGILGD